MSQDIVYMDYASASKTDPRVIDAMLPYMKEYFGNPSSPHTSGLRMKSALEEARASVARLVNAEKPTEIVFTSGATESNNMALRGVAFRNKDRGNQILATRIEHISVLNTLKYLTKFGFEVTYVPVDSYGLVDLEALKNAITDRTILVTIGYANNEVGTIQQIREISEIVHSKNAYLHTDATAAVGKIPVDVLKDGVDLMTISSWDMYGPYGIGALYIKKGTRVEPLIIGGGQEGGLRSGTENVPGAVGMGKAAELAMAEMSSDASRLSKMRDRLIEGILKNIPYSFLNGHPTRRLPHNANVRFSFVEGESLVLSLDMEGIAVSSGSACSSKTLEPSHVLIAMGIPHVEAQGSLLMSLGRFNKEEDVDRVLEVLPRIVKGLREMSPLTPKEVS
ncbi:MAG: cysteine desulfurase family protein [Candidatus Methanomethyliaceae archaeon]|nr:cysteine desulfurase family protein [Candidatus Verstraetearchaeota archaeon]